MSKLSKRNIWKFRVTWKLFKSAIFIACVACFTWQSVNFFEVYFTYPTVTSIDLSFPEELIKPAVTLCNYNPVKREIFCAEYPHLCQTPNNLTEFCKKHPYFCTPKVSNLVIPKLGYFTNNSMDEVVRDTLMEMYIHNISEKGADLWSWKLYTSTESKKTFFYEDTKSTYVTCFSTNLHINSSEEVETVNSNPSGIAYVMLNGFYTFIREEETIYPWTVPRIFLNVHSPFVPSTSPVEGVFLEKNHVYILSIQMEEMHLLESPYKTNCTDYEDLWRKNNKTGPRSQEMCKEWCKWNIYKSCNDCERGLSMLQKPKKVCTSNPCNKSPSEEEIIDTCRRSCKVNCKKLIYHYKVFDELTDSLSRIAPAKNERNLIVINMFFKNPEVIVMSHKPLYNGMDVFSYIGGLMGCWLGISVWACTGIAEETFLALLYYLKQFAKKSRNLQPVRDQILI